MQLQLHGGKNQNVKWATIEVNGVSFKASAKVKRGQAYLLIDAPRDLVQVTREGATKKEKTFCTSCGSEGYTTENKCLICDAFDKLVGGGEE